MERHVDENKCITNCSYFRESDIPEASLSNRDPSSLKFPAGWYAGMVQQKGKIDLELRFSNL